MMLNTKSILALIYFLYLILYIVVLHLKIQDLDRKIDYFHFTCNREIILDKTCNLHKSSKNSE